MVVVDAGIDKSNDDTTAIEALRLDVLDAGKKVGIELLDEGRRVNLSFSKTFILAPISIRLGSWFREGDELDGPDARNVWKFLEAGESFVGAVDDLEGCAVEKFRGEVLLGDDIVA
jgi:hypothetical protein